jgi:hypothetical protein
MKKAFVLATSALALVALLVACQNGGASSSVASSKAASSSASSSSSVSAFTKKSLAFYIAAPANKETMDFYFSKDNPEIPFIDTETMLGLLDQLKGFKSKEHTPITCQGHLLTMTLQDGQEARFDFDAKTINFPNAEQFFARVGSHTSLNSFGQMTTDESGAPTYLKEAKDPYVVAGHPLVANLGQNEIPMILENGVGYLPLATFSDVFANSFSFQFYSNGINVFAANDRAPLQDLYYQAPKGARSQALADFTYHEFCLNGDFNYALKAKHGITTFDDFLSRTGRKEGLRSTDPHVADATLAYVLETDLDDNHSAVGTPSFYSGSDFDLYDSKYKGTSNTFWDEHNAALVAARSKAATPITAYQEVGKTAFVTFDEFTSCSGDYYTNFPTETEAAKDTFALIEYAHKKIKEDGMTSVVLDLTCNRGGAATAAAYVSCWMLGGSATLHFSALLDDAKASFPMCVDVNLDKTFDANDGVADKKLYCLTSLTSFSSGNLVPSVLKSSGKVTMVGETSGGGACVVDGTCLADGTAFNFSGSHAVCTVKNGVYYDVDTGVLPDYPITDLANFYDRANLVSYLATLK